MIAMLFEFDSTTTVWSSVHFTEEEIERGVRKEGM
jgi:hypothetical protein